MMEAPSQFQSVYDQIEKTFSSQHSSNHQRGNSKLEQLRPHTENVSLDDIISSLPDSISLPGKFAVVIPQGAISTSHSVANSSKFTSAKPQEANHRGTVPLTKLPRNGCSPNPTMLPEIASNHGRKQTTHMDSSTTVVDLDHSSSTLQAKNANSTSSNSTTDSASNSSSPSNAAVNLDAETTLKSQQQQTARPSQTDSTIPSAQCITDKPSLPPKPVVNTQQQQEGKVSPHVGRKNIGDWMLGKTIGEGSSGKVKLAENPITGEKCVVKAVRRPKLSTGETATEVDVSKISQEALLKIYKRELYMIREAALGVMLEHPNIVRLHSAVLGENHFYCFFDYVEGEDLVDYITRLSRLSERRARSIFRQVISAIEYAHRNHVIHRDIKLENIRYNEKTGVAKLLDFGFATFYSNKDLLETNCGSPCYAAPEIYDNKPYLGPEIDIWSLGVCLYGMVTGSLPFDGPSFRILSSRVRSGRVVYPSYLSEEIEHLISIMLITAPRRRATLDEVIRHPWTNQGSKTLSVDYIEDPKRSSKTTIHSDFVDKIIASNICDAGCHLMQVLKQKAPIRKQQIEDERKQKLEETLNQQDGSSSDDSDKQVSSDDVFDISVNDKGGRVWWKRLLRGFSRASHKFHGRAGTEEVQLGQPIDYMPNRGEVVGEPGGTRPLLTRIFRRRVATASGFTDQHNEVQELERIQIPTMNANTNKVAPQTSKPMPGIPTATKPNRFRAYTQTDTIPIRPALYGGTLSPVAAIPQVPLTPEKEGNSYTENRQVYGTSPVVMRSMVVQDGQQSASSNGTGWFGRRQWFPSLRLKRR